MIYILLFVSIILEGIISLIIPIYHSIFVPTFLLITIICIYPYFKDNYKKYFMIIFIAGLVYDFLYTQTLFLDAVIFLLLAFLYHKVYKYINYKFLGTIIIFVLSISLYRISIFLILCITGYNIFSFSRLWMSILDSLVLNIIYGLFLQKFLECFYERRFLYSKIY